MGLLLSKCVSLVNMPPEVLPKNALKLVELFSGHDLAGEKQNCSKLRSLLTFIPAGNKWQCLKFGHVQKGRFLDTIWTKTRQFPHWLSTFSSPHFFLFFWTSKFYLAFYGGKSFSKHRKDPEIIWRKYRSQWNEISFGIFCCWLSGSLGVNLFCYSIM